MSPGGEGIEKLAYVDFAPILLKKMSKSTDFEEMYLEVAGAFGVGKVSKNFKIDENMFKQCFLTTWTSIGSIRVNLEA